MTFMEAPSDLMPSPAASPPQSFVEVWVAGGVPQLRGSPSAEFYYYAGGTRMAGGWTWQGGQLRVCSDRYGLLPLFWSYANGRLRVSPSIPRLLEEGACRDLDDDALAVFVRLGSFVGADTPFRAIRALGPDTVLTWSAERIEETGTRPIPTAAADASFDTIVDEYGARFRAAMADAPWSADASVLPLSGGKDSRHILLELHATSRPPARAVTFEQLPWQEANLDVPLASELARRTRIAHVLLPQAGDPLRNEIAKNLLTSLCSDEHTHAMALVHFLAGKSGIVYDGLAGDVLSESKVRDGSWSEALGAGRIAEVAARELGPAGYVDRILLPDLARRWSRERALARLEQELGRYRDDPNPFGSYRFWNRARREVALAPLGMLAEGNVICLPYLHPPLFDFLSALPASLLSTERIHTAAMRRGYPAFADIPFDHERRQPTALPYRPRRTARHAARERIHSGRWITASVRYALRGSGWLKPGSATLLAARSIAQPGHPSLPWLPRMLVYLGMLERIAREELVPSHAPAARPGTITPGMPGKGD